jgi:hypothetical protein
MNFASCDTVRPKLGSILTVSHGVVCRCTMQNSLFVRADLKENDFSTFFLLRAEVLKIDLLANSPIKNGEKNRFKKPNYLHFYVLRCQQC